MKQEFHFCPFCGGTLKQKDFSKLDGVMKITKIKECTVCRARMPQETAPVLQENAVHKNSEDKKRRTDDVLDSLITGILRDLHAEKSKEMQKDSAGIQIYVFMPAADGQAGK